MDAISIEQYIDQSRSIQDHLRDLCDKKSFPDAESDGVNQAIMAFVMQYTAKYFSIAPEELRDLKEWLNGEGKKHEHIQKALSLHTDRQDPASGLAAGSLLDTRATAAFVKEIAFGEPPKLQKDEIALGVDFGSGSNILSFAGCINANREKAHLIMYGFEHNELALLHSTRLCAELCEKINYRVIFVKNVHFDVSGSDPYETISGLMEQHNHALRYWISETFNQSIPDMEVQETDVRWKWELPVTALILGRISDPFVFVVEQSCKSIPDFIKNVREGETLMFPDIVGERIKFAPFDSKIKLLGSGDTFIPFGEVGDVFAEFEDLGTHSRLATREQHEKFLGKERMDEVMDKLRKLTDEE